MISTEIFHFKIIANPNKQKMTIIHPLHLPDIKPTSFYYCSNQKILL